MSEIAVIGESKFILGFQLAGIQTTKEIDNPDQVIDVMKEKRFGIVIIDEPTMTKLPEHYQMMVQESIHPVAVVLSEKESSDDLRKMIIKSIGVDVWNK